MIRSGHHRLPLHDKFGSPFVERNFLLMPAWQATIAIRAAGRVHNRGELRVCDDDRRLTPVGTSYTCPSVENVYTYSQVASGGPRCTPDRAAACCQLFDCENMQGGSMLDIHFYCPNVRRRIDTGIQVDQITFERTRLNIVHVPCPHCDRIHRFLMADSQISISQRRQLETAACTRHAYEPLAGRDALESRRRRLDAVERSRQEHSPARLANCSRTGELSHADRVVRVHHARHRVDVDDLGARKLAGLRRVAVAYQFNRDPKHVRRPFSRCRIALRSAPTCAAR